MRFNNWKVLGGASLGDYNTHRTLFAGPDPADPKRVLVRKLVQTSEKVWCFEESRISAPATEGGIPTVHTTLHRLGATDVNEQRVKIACAFGADLALRADADVVARLREAGGGRGVDKVLVCTAARAAMRQIGRAHV